MKKKTVYVAFDGKEFSKMTECESYEERIKEGRTITYLLNKKVRFFSGYVEQIEVNKLFEKAGSIKYIYFDGLSFDEKNVISSIIDENYSIVIDIGDEDFYIKDAASSWFYPLESFKYRFDNRIKSYKKDKETIEKMIAKESF